MNEHLIVEHKRQLLEREIEITLLKMELGMKNLLWFFSGCLATAIAMYAISMSM